MNATAFHKTGISIVVAGAAFLAACADDAPTGANRRLALPDSGTESRAVDLGVCSDLRAPAGSKLAFHVYAAGVQIYHWNGTGWTFDGPSATLSADAAGKSTVGIHYAGPTWESNSGGKVVGSISKRCQPDPNAIAWLLLTAVSDGPGIFHRVTHIQRVNTVGGNAPSDRGNVVGEEARVPYTTEYLFYRAH